MTLAVQQNLLDSMLVAERRAEKIGSHSIEFSLFSLPIATQAVYSVLLMIPIGALVILFLRNFVGVKTFGTFMPVLVALAFRETLLVWGIVLFVVIVSLGLLIRFYLEKLRLLLVPRLTVRADGGRAADGGHQRAQPQARHPARPVDRAVPDGHHLDDDRAHVDRLGRARRVGGDPGRRRQPDGRGGGLRRHGHRRWLEHLIFVFPELLLLVIAAALLAGRYTGYRLLELRRFKALRPDRGQPSGSAT